MKRTAMKRTGIKRKAKAKKKRKKPTLRKVVMKDCDIMWSKVVRNRDKTCKWCGKRPSRHAHHIFSRRYVATRHDLDNGIGLCGGCHMAIHQYPELGRDWLISWMPDTYLELKKLAKFGEKVPTTDLEEIKIYLEEKLG